MSRIGKLPIDVPAGVEVNINNTVISVKGKGGSLELQIPEDAMIQMRCDDATLYVSRDSDSKKVRSYHGLYRKLIANMITGVSVGFSKTLLINGVGYRAELKGSSVLLNLGYSTQFEYLIPEGITIEVMNQTKLVVSGIEKQKVGQVAAEIRSLRPVEPYKGKGIQYENEKVRRKVGKSGVK